MTEEFLKNAFSLMGEDSVVSIKIIKNKFTGAPASYGFIHFDSDAAALMAMHKLNNKMIPHSAPVNLDLFTVYTLGCVHINLIYGRHYKIIFEKRTIL